FASGGAIAKWIVTSLQLCKPFRFEIGTPFRCVVLEDGTESIVTWRSGHAQQAMSQGRAAAMPAAVDGTLDLSELTAVAIAIEEYFRPNSFRMDRIAVGLSGLWSSFCARYPEHAFLSLSMIVESLLSTQE